eukprot:m.178039 g.178039  ORF g.178039 m.178039 type:complete len:154 (-) comp15356_c0_seq11:470-931(-)
MDEAAARFETLAARLKRNDPALEEVNLGFGSLGPHAHQLAEALKGNTVTKMLSLRHCKLTGAQMAVLFPALNLATSLRTLDVSQNDIDPVGAAVLSKALQTNTSLIFVDLSVCNLEDRGAEELAGALTANTCLTVLKLGHAELWRWPRHSRPT